MTSKPNRAAPRLFAGKVSPDDAIKGARLTQANALRLIADARLLLEAGRYPSAAMLAVMALDEIAKLFHALTLAAVDSPSVLAAGWKEFRNSPRRFPWSLLQSVSCDGALESISDADLDDMLDFVRRLGSAVEIVDPGLWIDPAELISRELAASVVETAALICNRRVDTKAMEIWIYAVRSSPRRATGRDTLEKYRRLLDKEGLANEASKIAESAGHSWA
jgi:AbiV family abortive infection protein